MKTTKENEIIIFNTKDGPAVDVQVNNETAWLNQNQMTDLFEKETFVKLIVNLINQRNG